MYYSRKNTAIELQRKGLGVVFSGVLWSSSQIFAALKDLGQSEIRLDLALASLPSRRVMPMPCYGARKLNF